MTVVFYALNGVGVGHLIRLRSIAAEMRRSAFDQNRKLSVLFITSSEADQLLYQDGFPCFKVPSRLSVERAGMDIATYRDVAVRVVQGIIDNVGPDLLVVDTAPTGSFGEFAPDCNWDPHDCCGATAFVFRPVRRRVAERPLFQASLARYDLVLVPEHEEAVDPFVRALVPEKKLKFSGPVLSRELADLPSRQQARIELGIADDELAVYVSTGGGGYMYADKQIESITRSLSALPCLKLLVLPGPLYSGAVVKGEGIIWCNPQLAGDAMAAADMAVSAAGYNSFYELMACRIPTVFIPLISNADDQRARALRAVQVGASQMLPMNFDDNALRQAVSRWSDKDLRAEAAAATARIQTVNCAKVAASELLSMLG